MKLLSTHNLKKMCLAATAIIAMVTATAQDKVPYAPQSLDEAVNTPYIKDNKSRNAIANYQTQQAHILSEDRNLNVLLTRNQEVIIITIPADQLFEINSSRLTRDGERMLKPYASLLRTPDYYRMALAMYHDNNGSPSYCKKVTDERLQSVYDWFVLNANEEHVSAFSFGSADPVKPNNSIRNRRMNRRLEIYLIPGNMMIEQAKKNLLR